MKNDFSIGKRIGEEIYNQIKAENNCYDRFPEIHYTKFEADVCSPLCDGHCFDCEFLSSSRELRPASEEGKGIVNLRRGV